MRNLNEREQQLIERHNKRNVGNEFFPDETTKVSYQKRGRFVTLCFLNFSGKLSPSLIKVGVAVRTKNDKPNETIGEEVSFIKALEDNELVYL